MNRRRVLAAPLALLAAPGRGQAPVRVPRIGMVAFGDAEPFHGDLRRALADIGLVDGRNVVLVSRSAGGQVERLASLVKDLLADDPAVLVASATPSIEAARAATRTVPIVMATAGDALGSGLVQSLSRPGGNVTGFSNAIIDLAGKTVSLMREALPGIASVGCVVLASDPLHRGFAREAGAMAAKLGLAFRPAVLAGPDELPRTFAAMARDRVGGVLVQPIFTLDTATVSKVVELGIEHRLPTVSGLAAFARRGGLMAYTSQFTDLPQRVAEYVRRILGGTPPGELPVQRPTRFDLLLNASTARRIGVVFPTSFLVQAQEVVE